MYLPQDVIGLGGLRWLRGYSGDVLRSDMGVSILRSTGSTVQLGVDVQMVVVWQLMVE